VSRAHVANNTGAVEWYTPASIVTAARAVLRTIDLDPASCAAANRIVKARLFYSQDDDGLTKQWSGRVFMNPPYAGGVIGRFVKKLVEHYRAGEVSEAVVLVNNATETDWFQSLAGYCSAACFVTGRLRFWRPDKSTGTPLQGQVVCYLGARPELFKAEFERFGFILYPVNRHETTGELFGNPEGRPALFGRAMNGAERARRARAKRKVAALADIS
jgi:ParB family chromosome partitioning protein